MSEYERFDSWEEAFDTCRERDRPLTITVWDNEDERGWVDAKIFPSGHVAWERDRAIDVYF